MTEIIAMGVLPRGCLQPLVVDEPERFAVRVAERLLALLLECAGVAWILGRRDMGFPPVRDRPGGWPRRRRAAGFFASEGFIDPMACTRFHEPAIAEYMP